MQIRCHFLQEYYWVVENNHAVAGLLRQIATLLDEQGVAFKPNAYRKAAQVLEDLPRDVAEFKDEKELMELPGIGEAIAAKIREYVRTGRIHFLDDLLAQQGGLPAELMEVENLGPKRVRQLQKMGITTVAGLIKAAEEGKLRELPRLSPLLEQKILESAKRVTERSKRFPREEVAGEANELLETICSVDGVERAEIAGSYRRHKATVGDLDVLVVTKSPVDVSNAIASLSIVRDVVAHGDKKLSFNLAAGIRVDVRFVDRDQWGSALLYFTGDKEHNISLRKRAIERGWKLNEYGLFEGEKLIASKEEEDIYRALDLPMIEPTKRTSLLPA